MPDVLEKGKLTPALWRDITDLGTATTGFPTYPWQRSWRGYQAMQAGQTHNPFVLLNGPPPNPKPKPS